MRSYIIRAFLPWLIFLAFADGTPFGLKMATLGGAFCLLLFNRQSLKQKFFFDWASFIFFMVMWMAGVGLPHVFFINYSLILAYGFLALICFMSLWLNMPVALQYAKQKTDKRYWNNPVFIGVGNWLTAIWGLLFFAITIVVALFYLGFGNKLWMIEIIPVATIILGIGVTVFLPDAYRKKLQNDNSVATISGISDIKIAKIGSVQIAYRTLGKGPLLILIYGGGMTMHHWDPDLLKLLSQNYEVLIFDYPGIGCSTYKNMPYTTKSLANCLKGMVDELKLKPVGIVGYSMGGWIAEEFAIAYSDKTQAIILLATSVGGDDFEKPNEELVEKYSFEAIVDGSKPDRYKFILEIFFPSHIIPRVTKKLKNIYDSAILDGIFTGEIIQKEKKLTEAWYKNDSIAFQLKAITLPALLITGKQDVVVPPGNTQILHQLIKDSKVVEYKDAGHGVIYQYPRDIADEIHAFLKDRA